MLTLIADSGSTKTDWALTGIDPSPRRVSAATRFHTQGINPIHQSDNEIRQILHQELLPYLSIENISYVYFYGSGVRPEKEASMAQLLREMFSCAEIVEAHSDLLGAARALCGHNYGIASILGTGANSCLYDGKNILQHTPALGYILGDEGSGAVMGKHFLHDLYCGLLSEDLKDEFEKKTKLSLPEIINRVYSCARALSTSSASILPHTSINICHFPLSAALLITSQTSFLRPSNPRNTPSEPSSTIPLRAS